MSLLIKCINNYILYFNLKNCLHFFSFEFIYNAYCNYYIFSLIYKILIRLCNITSFETGDSLPEFNEFLVYIRSVDLRMGRKQILNTSQVRQNNVRRVSWL